MQMFLKHEEKLLSPCWQNGVKKAAICEENTLHRFFNTRLIYRSNLGHFGIRFLLAENPSGFWECWKAGRMKQQSFFDLGYATLQGTKNYSFFQQDYYSDYSSNLQIGCITVLALTHYHNIICWYIYIYISASQLLDRPMGEEMPASDYYCQYAHFWFSLQLMVICLDKSKICLNICNDVM